MNPMNMPGFTAERGMHGIYKHYSTSVHTSANPQVIPQLRIGCFLRAASRTYSRCIGLGYDSGACSQVAIDLGLSVCDD